MTTQISGTTGVSQIQDGTVTSAKIVDGGVAAADMATAVQPIGVGQTWQDMTGLGGRAIAASITNSSGRPIQVAIQGILSAAASTVSLTVGGILVSRSQAYTATAQFNVSAIVPDGVTYSIAQAGGTATIQTWAELR